MEPIPAIDLDSIAGSVLARARQQPDAIAVEDGERRLTYAELDAASAAIAAALQDRGVEPEEVVGVCLDRSWRAIAAFLGIVRAGGAYLPIGASYPLQRKRDLLELAGARLLLTDSERDFELPPEAELLDIGELAAGSGEPQTRGGGDSLAYVVFTSGSTGVPKGVEITHANLRHLFASGSSLLPVPGDAVLSVAALEFDITALEIWGALTSGSRLVLAPPGRPDPRQVGRLIAEREVTFAFFPAGLFEQVVRASLPDLGGMRLIAAGGDVMAPAAAKALRTTHPQVRVLNGYGPTETSIVATGYEVGEVDGTPLPIGAALPGYDLYVLDEEMQPVATGEAGELWIGGPGVARGYRGNPEGTRERFREDPFGSNGARMYGSGDIVRVRDDGNLEFLGRADHQVKISGYRVEPGEVEQMLGAHPAVAQAAVVAREDVQSHKRLLAYASLRDGEAVGEQDLLDHLAERLPSFMVPSALLLMAELPLTERGKIDRRALPDPARSPGDGPADGAAGEVAALMAELLGLDAVGPDDDFGLLGGDSLLTLQLLGRVRDRFGSDLDINAAFEARTPRRLAALIDSEEVNQRPPLRRVDSPEPPPATFAQRRAWLFERMNPDSLSFQFAALMHLRGDLDEDALRGAIRDLVERHEVFRTSLQERDGEPVQIVHDDLPVPFEVVDGPEGSGPEWARLVRRLARRRIRLDQGPLCHWTLIRRGPGRWALIDVEHHAAHDGWSFMIVLAELAELYSARVEGRSPNLPEQEIRFGDFARWERELVSGDLERRQLDFWRRTLDPDPPLIELPAAKPRDSRESFAGGSVRRRMRPQLAGEVRKLAREEGATAYMAGLAAFALLLGRSGGVEDLQIGSGLANRRDPAAEHLVGMTVGTAALRVDLSGDPTVRELLQRVRGTVLDAIANADVPFEQVVETLAPRRDPSRSPLVQTMFSFDDAPGGDWRWTGLEVEVVQTIPNGTAKADVNVIGVDHGDGKPFYIWEHSDLISDATAYRLAGQHLNLLEQFVADPEARVSGLDLAVPEEAEELSAWSRNEDSFDREASIPELVERQARRDPAGLAVVEEDQQVTYGELVDSARRVAGSLRAQGVKPGEAVAILLPRSAASVAAFLGVLDAGAAYVPLDPSHPAERIGKAIADAGAQVVLTRLGMEGKLPAGIRAVDLGMAQSGEPIEPTAGPEDLAYVMYTSGSTGEPKGVEVTHRNVARLVDDPAFADLGPGTRMLHAASPAFDATTLELWGPLANGGAVAILAEQPSPDAVADAVERHGVTTIWLTAGLFHELVDRRPDCLSQVRHLLAGGDVLSPTHVARALQALPADARLSNGYGPTETTTFALTHDLRPGDPVDGSIPLGRPIQSTVCEVVDTAGKPAPVGVAGELWIGGDGVARGYRGDPELTAARFVAAPGAAGRRYRTGDRVRRRADGTIEFLGRLDRQLKIRGVRVEPAEIETVLREHRSVRDAVVVPYEPNEGDKALAAYVVAAEGPVEAAELRRHAGERLPAAMVPAAWIELEKLPLTANGKIDRAQLPEPGVDHLAREQGGDAPRNEAERKTVEIFERVLGVERVGVEEDFFALGGHSLLAVGLFSQLEDAFGRRLPLATILEASTPRALAELLVDPPTAAKRWSNLVPIKPTGTRPPLFAATAGDGNVVGFAPLGRHLSPEQPLYALQPSGLDGQAAIDRGFEAAAARCIEEMRSVQAHGPYLLAGRCNGATVAFEIAQQLRASGEEVALLASLDSDPPNAGPRELEPGLRTDPLMETAWLRGRDAGEDVPDLGGPGGPVALATWLREERAPGISRYGHEIWHWREDLPGRWPDPLGADAGAFRKWLWRSGVPEQGLEPRLLVPALEKQCRLPNGHRWDWALEQAWRELDCDPIDPLTPTGWERFRSHLLEPVGDGRANRYLRAAAERPDLAQHFGDPLGADLADLLFWAYYEGVAEGLAPELLPPSLVPLPRRLRLELALRPARRLAERATEAARAPETRKRAKLQRDRLAALAERGLDRRLPRARRRTDGLIEAGAREAKTAYRAQPWPGKIVLVTSPEYERKPAYLAWPERAQGGIEQHVLPVGHIEMLRDPGAGVLARCLEDRIAEALRR